jgi:hypothetical protein
MLPLVFSVAHLVISQGQLQVSVMPSVLARSGFAGKLKEVTRSRGQLHIGSFIASKTAKDCGRKRRNRQSQPSPVSYRRRTKVAQSQLQNSLGSSTYTLLHKCTLASSRAPWFPWLHFQGCIPKTAFPWLYFQGCTCMTENIGSSTRVKIRPVK